MWAGKPASAMVMQWPWSHGKGEGWKASPEAVWELVQGHPMYLPPGDGELLFTLFTVRGFIILQPGMALWGEDHNRIPFSSLALDGPIAMF